MEIHTKYCEDHRKPGVKTLVVRKVIVVKWKKKSYVSPRLKSLGTINSSARCSIQFHWPTTMVPVYVQNSWRRARYTVLALASLAAIIDIL